MTPEEIATIFADTTATCSPIAGEPTDDDLTAIRKVLLPILHNIDYDMTGPNNLVGLIEGPTAYTAIWGQAFPRPVRPTPVQLDHPRQCSSTQRTPRRLRVVCMRRTMHVKIHPRHDQGGSLQGAKSNRHLLQ
jgi:hypothetical protein